LGKRPLFATKTRNEGVGLFCRAESAGRGLRDIAKIAKIAGIAKIEKRTRFAAKDMKEQKDEAVGHTQQLPSYKAI
jgi:hypothetical protein